MLAAKNNQKNLTGSVYDGIFANMFATLTGGVFLTGFALYLEMNEFLIGLLAATPFFVTVFQFPTAYLINKNGSRKKTTCWAAAGARLIWIPVILTAAGVSDASVKWLLILCLIFISHTFASVSYVSWLSWMSDIVPPDRRGRFFGTRNMFCGAAGIVTLLFFGNFLDFMKMRGLALAGFSVTITAAVFFGLLSLHFLSKISEPAHQPTATSCISFLSAVQLPFREKIFRNFLKFNLLWSFAVYFASPFFTLYFLRDLAFGYSFVALMGVLASLADLLGMRLWGQISDKLKNKVIIQFAGGVAAFLPLAWTFVTPRGYWLAAILQIVGGGIWAGITLCIHNLLLGVAPQENKPIFFSAFNIIGGLGAAAGTIAAGFILHKMPHAEMRILSRTVLPLHIIFLLSTLLRVLSLRRLRFVKEMEGAEIGQMIRILRNVRGLNISTGFNYLLHPFIEINNKQKALRQNGSKRTRSAQTENLT